MAGIAASANSREVNSPRPASASASSSSPARRNHAGVNVRTSQSHPNHARVSSSVGPVFVPITLVRNGFNKRSRSAWGSPSFHARQNAPITGDTHAG
jgi:hypothetical protein